MPSRQVRHKDGGIPRIRGLPSKCFLQGCEMNEIALFLLSFGPSDFYMC